MSYDAKNDLVRNRQLKVQELCIPFSIVGNATAADVAVSSDEPSLLFIKTEGTDQITVENGACSSAELSAITFVAADDSDGKFNLLVKIGEQVSKVVSAKIVRRNGQEVISASLTSAPSTGVTSEGDKIVLNADSGVDLSAATLDACLELKYTCEQ